MVFKIISSKQPVDVCMPDLLFRAYLVNLYIPCYKKHNEKAVFMFPVDSFSDRVLCSGKDFPGSARSKKMGAGDCNFRLTFESGKLPG